MKLGLWGARMDNSGLGMQTWEFFRNLKPFKTLVVDISPLERFADRKLAQYPERYDTKDLVDKDAPEMQVSYIQGIPNEQDIRDFLTGLDVVFIAESAYNMSFYQIARQMGVKTAVQYNYEFFDWFGNSIWEAPDLFIAPSTWHYDDVQQLCDQKNIKHVYLHCPVAREKIQRRYIDSAITFVHIAGRPAANDRNGTYSFLNAIALAEDDLKGRVYTQDKALANEIKAEYPSIDVKVNTTDYTDIYKKGSVLVLPRKYGGNCLPMNEALAAGMPVIMSKLSPQIDFLPEQWLVPAQETDIDFAPRFKLPVYEVDPAALMLKMRWFKSMGHKELLDQSNMADYLAQTISWKEMKPKYVEVFEALCQI